MDVDNDADDNDVEIIEDEGVETIKCSICLQPIQITFFEIPEIHRNNPNQARMPPICGCCAMDSTIMGRFAPYTLGYHKRFELFMGWYVSSLHVLYEDVDMEIWMDTRVDYFNTDLKPDFLVMFKRRGSTNLCALHVEADIKRKTAKNMASKALELRNEFFERNPTSTNRCMISLNVFFDVMMDRYGLFEILFAFKKFMDVMVEYCMERLHAPQGSMQDLSGHAILNYLVGFRTVYNFNLLCDKDWTYNLFKHFLIDPDTNMILKFNSSTKMGNVNNLPVPHGVYKNFKRVYTEMKNLIRTGRVREVDMFLCVINEDVYVGVFPEDHGYDEVMQNTDASYYVRVLDHEGPVRMKGRMMIEGVELFECFYNTSLNRAYWMRKLESHGLRVEGISDIELTLKHKKMLSIND